MDKNSEITLEKPQRSKNTPMFFSRKKLRFGVLSVVVLAVCASVFYFYGRSSAESESLSALNEAFRSERPVQPRISGMNYAPRENRRGNISESAEKIDEIALETAKRFAVDALRNGETAESLHSLSRVYLAEKEFEKAETQLEKAHKIAPESAEILNDLGIVYLEKSKKLGDANGGKQLELRAKALEHFEKAIEIKNDFAAAVFNKALCLQTLSLPNQAAEAWREFLKSDASSNWANEARQNLETLTTNQPNKTAEELLQDFMQAFRARDDEKAFEIVSRNREMITGKLIPQRLIFEFLEAEGAQKAEYSAALKYVGDLEKQKTGDPFFAQIAEFYANASNESLKILRIAQFSIRKGYEANNISDNKNALIHFSQASKLLENQMNFAEKGICDYWIAYTHNRLNEISISTKILDDLISRSLAKNYKWLALQSFSWNAANYVSTKDFSKSLSYNVKALKLAEEISDLHGKQKSFSQRTDIYRRLGQYRQALNFTHKSLLISILPESSLRQKWRDYDAAATLFYEMRLYKISGAFEREALHLATNSLQEKTFVYQSYLNLGSIYGVEGKYKDSFEFFSKAKQISKQFDLTLQEKSDALGSLRLAHIQRLSGNCFDALMNYENAVNFYKKGEFQANVYDAHKGKLLCHSANDDERGFQNEFAVIIGLFREYRVKILEEQSRNSFFDNEQTVYDLGIEYEFDNGNYEKAFEYSEESRARSLLDLKNTRASLNFENEIPEIRFSSEISNPLTLSQIQAEMPSDAQIVKYSLMEKKILIWVITKENFTVVQSQISLIDLEQKISEFLELIDNHDDINTDREKAVAKELYRNLVLPIADKIDKNKAICLIPDKILLHLPFAALISSEDKYFISDYNILYAPSATIFVGNSQKSTHTKSLEKILSIGNPLFNKELFNELSNLQSAKKEAIEIAEFYQKSVVLTEADAEKERIIKEFEKTDVIHFAGHYIVNTDSPMLSGFVLAENERSVKLNKSVLANYEIFGKNYSKTKLIVLSGCQTGIEGFYRGEGITGASRTFLGAGIPQVVASFWAVDSDATSQLMIKFHFYLKKKGLSTTESLRKAQIEMIESENEIFRKPFYWSAFAVFGGYAS